MHGFPRIMGVLTHLDHFKNNKALRRTKKALKHRFWTEIYDGAKLFYLSGLSHGRYPKVCARGVLKLGARLWGRAHGKLWHFDAAAVQRGMHRGRRVGVSHAQTLTLNPLTLTRAPLIPIRTHRPFTTPLAPASQTEVQNLSRFISVMRFRPLSWRNTHAAILADRMEDLTPPATLLASTLADRTVALYGCAPPRAHVAPLP